MPDHGLSLRTTARTDDVSPDAMPDARPLPLLLVCLLAVLVGIVGGFGAVVFRGLIAGYTICCSSAIYRRSTISACSRRCPLGAVSSSWCR